MSAADWREAYRDDLLGPVGSPRRAHRHKLRIDRIVGLRERLARDQAIRALARKWNVRHRY